jgi:hypothetical protein
MAKTKLLKNWKHPLDAIFTEDEKIELITRDILREFKHRDSGAFLDDPELERVIFEVVYPSFGFRQKERWRSSEVERLMEVVNSLSEDSEDSEDEENTNNGNNEDDTSTWSLKCLVQ